MPGQARERSAESKDRSRGALFVLPTGTADQQGPVAAWISTAGWAGAARRLWGDAWIVSPGMIVSPEQALMAGSWPSLMPRDGRRRWTRRVPVVLKTAGKDVRRYRRSRRFRPDMASGPWADRDLVFVWQRHEPFCVAGIEAREALDRPLVVFVPAPVQWEARQWGIRRPGWSRLFEARAERPALMAADLVACGSEMVADVIRRFGVPERRILVTPSGVDVSAFSPSTQRDDVRRSLGIGDRFVVGWSGSFRRFHGLELAVDAVAELQRTLPEVTLLLLGDGPERPHVQALCRERGIKALFTGTIPHDEMPHYVSAMDVALLLKPPVGGLHYSPLKLWEYLSCGVPVVAPAVGQPAALLDDGVHALLVEPDDAKAIVAAVSRLAGDRGLREILAAEGRRHVVEHGSWDLQLQRVHDALQGSTRGKNGSTAPTSSSTLISNV